MKKPVILLVDDDRNTRQGLQKALAGKYEVVLAESADRALEILKETTVDLLLSDVRMPGMDGLTLLQRALARSPQPVCIMMTAYGSIETAVEAMKRGASDYVTKPYSLDDLEIRIEKALRSRTLEAENASLQEQLNDKHGMENIIGESEQMHKVLDLIRQAAPTQASVLLQGESGTGKELVAHAIHRLSPRAKGPFVAVHCAALSQNLIESELFGHEKGAFTGANERRIGRFEMADGGTFFLDEVSEIPLPTQAKLLRVLEERCLERVGGGKTITVDIRLVAATNRNLKQMVTDGLFRNDLYFRMNVVNIDLPPLRERTPDVAIFCRHFLKEFNQANGKNVTDISSDAMHALSTYSWPGNVRELRNAIERMVIFSHGTRLTLRDVPVDVKAAIGNTPDRNGHSRSVIDALPESMDQAEKSMILTSLKLCNGNITRAAQRLGISRRTFHRKLKQYGHSGDAPAAQDLSGATA